jgi:hypothetical protein
MIDGGVEESGHPGFSKIFSSLEEFLSLILFLSNSPGEAG